MDEPTAQFYVTVGRLCVDASMADLTVRLRLADGTEVTGVPEPPADTEGADQLADTGFADTLRVGDAVIALSTVIAATLHHPLDRAPATP